MNRHFKASSLRIPVAFISAFLSFAAACVGQVWRAVPSAETSREKLHGVVSRRRLSPALRSTSVTLKYSSDGKYLLLQNPSGIYVLSREPLKVLGYIDSPKSYPAKFSADSQSIVVVSSALSYDRWAVRDGQNLERKQLPISDGCVNAQLSPDGTLLACYRPDFTLGVLQLSTGNWIFSDLVHDWNKRLTVFPIPLDFDTPFPGPFGFRLAHDMRRFGIRGTDGLLVAFSPSGSLLIAGDIRDAFQVDLATRGKTNLPSAIKKCIGETVAIQDEAHALVIPGEKPGEPAIRSLSNGAVLLIPNFKADSAYLATDARYIIFHTSKAQGARVFDLKENRALETPNNVAVDVFAGELVVLTENLELSLFRKGEHAALASVFLPQEGLPPLRSASVTPDLDKLAIAVDEEGNLFQIANGQHISSFQQFSAGNFVDSTHGFFLMRGTQSSAWPPTEYVIDRVSPQGTVQAAPQGREATLASSPQTIVHLDTTIGKTSLAWAGGKDLLRAGGPVFLDYSFEGTSGRGLLLPQESSVAWGAATQSSGAPLLGGMVLPQGVGVPFRLRALDLATGKELWSRSFIGLPPIPFADPQGDRLVLSWRAKSAGASAAAKHWDITKSSLKKAAVTDQDSFLEALDARTGKPVGGVLVQGGGSPVNFDWVFSAGEMLVFSRDAVRVQVYSMRDGQLKAKLVGARPSASAESNLLALETGLGQLAIYDLNTAVKLDEQIFPDAIAYTHFSADGQRLFVLTQSQSAFVLDMKGVHEANPLTQGVKDP
jgi:hypothetical protein